MERIDNSISEMAVSITVYVKNNLVNKYKVKKKQLYHGGAITGKICMSCYLIP